jgi:signal transduction histidine kinase
LARLTTRRTALALYSLLLVVPTLVLGGLLWFQLAGDHRAEQQQVPALASTAARRMQDGLTARFDELLARENERSFMVYRDFVYPEDLVGSDVAFLPSPLTRGLPPEGILSWFSFDISQGIGAEFSIFAGEHKQLPDSKTLANKLKRSVQELIVHDVQEGFQKRITRYGGLHISSVPLSLAVINFSHERDHSCLRAQLPSLRRLDDEAVDVHRYSFHVRFYRGADGTPRVVATRVILIDKVELLRGMPTCYSNLAEGALIHQGFFIDPEWLFGALPEEVAKQSLRQPEAFHPQGAALVESGETLVHTLYPVELLEIEVERPRDAEYGRFQISLSSAALRARQASQNWRLVAVACMLLLSLATGMVLLLRSVAVELEQARRTEDFVAAVTHELRTPIATIRLHGEMLRDGWVTTDNKRDEYHGRIVDETQRLEAMVERVLEKSRLSSSPPNPEPGDLNEVLRVLMSEEIAARDGVQLELAEGLGAVLMNRDGLRSIVTNLLENARKYGSREDGPREATLLCTCTRDGQPCLEVLDRGPGIPDRDKQRIFEAFFRRSDATTRGERGTGLGLHLVKIQAQAMDGDAQVLDRPGGGSIFRVTLRRADTAKS